MLKTHNKQQNLNIKPKNLIIKPNGQKKKTKAKELENYKP